jgi:hypothetical protein
MIYFPLQQQQRKYNITPLYLPMLFYFICIQIYQDFSSAFFFVVVFV